MIDKSEVLWRMFSEHMTQARQQETLRSSVTTVLTTIGIGAIGLITFDKELNVTDLPVAILLTALGGFGALFSAKHYERFQHHIARGRSYRDELEAMLSDVDWKALRKRADEKHDAAFPRLVQMRQYRFWMLFHGLIGAVGLVLSALILIYL
ncbi:MAG: hypothetical protein QM760_04215 [Nibricoccus sp.]